MRLREANLKALENLQRLGVPNLVQYLGGWSPFPVGVVFVLTMRCNLRCEMCPQVEGRQHGTTPELTLEQLKMVVDDLAGSFRPKPFIHLIGGEPLLRRDILELVEYIRQLKFNCSLTTNGLLLKRHADELVRLGVNRVHVSIDGPREVHDHERGVPGAFDLATAGIRALVAARAKSQGRETPVITVNTVITGNNVLYLEAMVGIARHAGATP